MRRQPNFEFVRDTEIFFQSCDNDIIDIILSNNGMIYGGYLRDCCDLSIANKINRSNDINIAVHISNKEIILKEINKIYTTSIHNINYNNYIFIERGRRTLNLKFINSNEENLHPNPDFDVNLLCYCRKYKLRSWMNSASIRYIIININNKKCKQLSTDEDIGDRKYIMQNKGYEIIA